MKAVIGILRPATLVEVVGKHKVILVDFLLLHGTNIGHSSDLKKQKTEKSESFTAVLVRFVTNFLYNFALTTK